MDLLLALRGVTTRLKRIPGAVFALEPVRRWYCREARSRVVADFDGTLLQVRMDEHMGSNIFWYGSYSREVLQVIGRILRPGMTVLDVGANIGEVALYAAKRVAPGGRVICFEPMPSLAEILRQNIARNRAGGVEVVAAGVADRVGSAPFYMPQQRFHDGSVHAGLATLYGQGERATAAGAISLTTLDHHAAEARLGVVHLIKLDVEGAELPALRGAEGVLRAHHPWLVIEVQRATCQAAGYDQADILLLLGELGYSFARIARRGRLERLTIEGLSDFQNVLAVPPGTSFPG